MGNSKSVIIAIIVLIIAVAAYFVFLGSTPEAPQSLPAATENISPVPTDTPDIGSEVGELSNPVGDTLPTLNPVEAANPFTDIYKNPFE